MFSAACMFCDSRHTRREATVTQGAFRYLSHSTLCQRKSFAFNAYIASLEQLVYGQSASLLYL